VKNCSKCKILQHTDNFYHDSSKKDGLSSYCKPCRIKNSNKNSSLNKDYIKQYKAKYYQQNKKLIIPKVKKTKEEKRLKKKEIARRFYLKHKEKISKKNKLYRIQHPGPRTQLKQWKINNPIEGQEYEEKIKNIRLKKKLAKNAKRRADKLKRTPKWANLKAIKEFYMNCPNGYHVDHIIPLKGKNVSGLHILENLQYLPAIENLKKGNRV
jgi:hypothetical protein